MARPLGAVPAGVLGNLSIFPLPDVVLLPHAVLPLHVFEPRYRELVRECVAGPRVLAIALLEPGWEDDYQGRPPVRAVAGVGELVGYEPLADGRANILLRGVGRVAIRAEHPPRRAFRQVAAEPLADHYPAGRDLAPGQAALRSLCDRVAGFLPFEGAAVLRQIVRGEPDPATLCDLIAAALVVEAPARQQVLECCDVADRIERVTVAVADVLRRLELEEGAERTH